MKTLQPIIKWTGSKRHLADEIISNFPDEIDTYYEPFCGGASVLFKLLHSNRRVTNYVISDTNEHLISVLNKVKLQPEDVLDHYRMLHYQLKNCDTDSNKADFYNEVRSVFNKDKNPLDFLFLTRTCTNGLIRFNQKGEFNTSFHHGRLGIQPEKYQRIVTYWSQKLNEYGVQIKVSDYCEVRPSENDFVFLDPPYLNTKASSMYGNSLDFENYCGFLKDLNCSYAFTFDGKSTKKDSTVSIDRELFDKHVYLSSQNSGMSRVLSGKGENEVRESLYIRLLDY